MKKDKNNKAKIIAKKEFTANKLTNFSGISTIYNFMTKLGIVKRLNDIDLGMHHNISYQTNTLLSLMILGLQSGMNRLTKIETFSMDPLVQKLLGLSTKISDSTLSNRFSRADMHSVTNYMSMIGEFCRKVHDKLGTKSDIIDLDSSVRTVYGNQEGAQKGFNEKKKGARSYHPLLAFLNSSRECLLSWLRPGNTYTANGSDEFFSQLMEMIHPDIRDLLLRADSGLFSEKLIQRAEQKGVNYLIKVKLKNMVEILSGQNWQKVPNMAGMEICDFYYKPKSWDKARRFYAVRILRSVEKEGVLFENKKWDYFCYCSDLEDSPLAIHRLYGDRGESENWIENVKNQMFAGDILGKKFFQNDMYWQTSILSYNISLWMRLLTDKSSWHEEPTTFRAWFVQLAGKVVRSGRQVFLKMYKAYYYKERWLKIDEGVAGLSFK
jgi:hypothetical protein